MRPFDRDLIRGGHYGQRSREPRSKAEHMAAPTNPAPVKKTLANSEPSTHGPSLPRRSPAFVSVIRCLAAALVPWSAGQFMTRCGSGVCNAAAETMLNFAMFNEQSWSTVATQRARRAAHD